MRFAAHSKRWAAMLSAVLLAATLTVLNSPIPAHADPGCTDSGVYVVFARGSGEGFDDKRAEAFRKKLLGDDKEYGSIWHPPLRPIDTAWAELGNLDKNFKVSPTEYPAIAAPWNAAPWLYGDSVRKGTNELVKHLNDRVARCPRESIVLGGYSQGADVIGWALERTWNGSTAWSLSPTTRSHIGYAALYGDPRFYAGPVWQRQADWRPWWVRGNDQGWRYLADATAPNDGVLGSRSPYAPSDFQGRLGSWCAAGDGVCTGTLLYGGWLGTHDAAYHGDTGWMADSANEIANRAITKRNQLNPHLSAVLPLTFTIADGNTASEPPAPPPPPVIHSVKRTTDPTGTRQVYAATRSAITEGWWIPGGDGIHLHEIIHIAQGDIVSFDKTNLPEGKQAVYTAVSDGVWESWWQPGSGVHSAKIISGLSGVRQVIVDNRQETQGYTHRLYILAGNGPHEYWWRDGGDGMHHRRLDSIAGPVAMDKSTGPNGEDQLYVATPTWVYELWWRPGESVHHGEIIHISQGDIRSLDKGDNLSGGGQLLYTGTSTTAWQSYWLGSAPSHGTIAQSQSNAIQIKKTVYNGVHELYLATGDHVQEYWWKESQSGGGELIRIPQGNITAIDKSSDGADQQLYTAAGDGVWETYWRGGSDPVGPTSKVLFGVER